MSEEQFWHPANICTWGFGHPSQMDGLHSPTPHLHPSNSPSLSSICATCQGHIPTGQKGKKTWALSFIQSTASFFPVQKLFSLSAKLCRASMEQVFGCESTGFFHATPTYPYRGSGALEHSKDAHTTALSGTSSQEHCTLLSWSVRNASASSCNIHLDRNAAL